MIRFCHLPMVRFVCMRTLIFLENKQTNNTFSRLSCGKKLLKSWQLQLHVLPGQDHTCPRSHLPQHDLPQHPPSLSGCHVPPPTSHSPAKCCWQHQHREAQRSETELSFHTLLSENTIKVQALLTLSNSSLTETMLLQRL